MYSQLPAILKCTYCGREGLSLSDGAQISELNGVETVTKGAVKCVRCGSSYPIEDGIVNFLNRNVKGISPAQRSNHTKLVAWGYERFWRPKALSLLGGRPWPPEEELATIIRMLEQPEPGKVVTHNETAFYLDQGCSTCFYGRAITRAIKANQLPASTSSTPAHVVALDNSWPMLQESRGFIEREGLTGLISLVRADTEKLPFIDGAFSGIANGGSLNEFRHTAKALEETKRTLAENGRIAYMVQMQARDGFGKAINTFLALGSGLHFFELGQLNRFYRQAGFKLIEQQGSGLITISQLLADREIDVNNKS